MYQIAEKDDALGMEFFTQCEELFAGAFVNQRSEFSAAALRPTIAEMQVRNEGRG
jgi:hypothetical protein